MSFEDIARLALMGLSLGGIYALLAIGFNVIFATTGVLNFAHGEFFMVGSMVGVFFYSSLGLPVAVALLVTVAIAVVIGMIEEPVASRPAAKGGGHTFTWVLSTLGFAIVMQSVVTLAMGTNYRRFPNVISMNPFEVAGVSVSPTRLAPFVLAIVVAGVLHTVYRRTIFGQALSAVAQDPDAAALRGLPVARLAVVAFGIGSAIAAMTGFLAAPITTAFPAIGLGFALKGFIAAAIGGMPDIRGAVAGGVLLGLVESFGSHWVGAGYQSTIVLGVLVLILALKPAGIFGTESVRSV